MRKLDFKILIIAEDEYNSSVNGLINQMIDSKLNQGNNNTLILEDVKNDSMLDIQFENKNI